MLGYATIGVSDITKAEQFYNEIFALVGGKQIFGQDRIKFYGTAPGAAMIAICEPYDKNDCAPGNGNMIAISGGDKEGVKALYNKALELGSTCDGEPGERLPIFYGAYVLDPDGNKLCFYEMKM